LYIVTSNGPVFVDALHIDMAILGLSSSFPAHYAVVKDAHIYLT
jgi:hypothetical protein